MIPPLLRTVLGATAAGLIAAGFASVPAPAAAVAEGAEFYVSLGDSMASGPLIPYPTGPLGCGRSTNNYPHELADRLDIARHKDVTCSGAKTKHMTEPQGIDLPEQDVPPQFNALTPDATLVTLTIGGNDVGLVGIAEDCVRLNPFATPCKGEHEETVRERLEELGPRLAAVLAEIRERAPRARVVVAGYGLYVKRGGCWPREPVLGVDADFLQGSVDAMNKVMEREAGAAGAVFVDLRTPSKGHDACQDPSDKWIEGFVPTSLAAPLHPNRRGEANYARIIAEIIREV